ncbi:MAG: DUF1294 domain-containing protein, partial [Defluviitaleaceae bacterium]|nr:DUF1294 domain-containing protein [Defluviitaleaceae bacterium]
MHHILSFGLFEFFAIILLLANVWTFALFAFDKFQAVRNRWRVSEKAMIFFALCGGGVGAALAMYAVRHKTRKVKFKIAAAVGVVVLLITAIHITHGLTLDRIVRFVEIEWRAENWPAEVNGYRIAFMADFHTIPDETMADVVAGINARDVDLLLLGGDFSHRDHHYRGTVREISRAITTDGIFGVEGNHDCYIRVFALKRQYGITPLDNDGVQIRDGFFIAGVHDLWNRNPCIETAIVGANVDDFVLLISHNPDVTMRQSTSGVDLILTAHTHGGHIAFFGLPFFLDIYGGITAYGSRFARGFAYSADETPVFATAGVGMVSNL